MLTNIGFIIGIALMYAAPLMFTAMGGVISEKSGVINIGLEGMMYLGAFIGAAVGYYSGNPWIAFLAAGFASGLLGLLHAVASVSFAGNQTISGFAINFIGPGIALFLSRLMFNGATMTKPIPMEGKMPKPFNGILRSLSLENTFAAQVLNQYATVYLAFILIFIVWFIFYKTRFGLRIRAVGEHPRAADTLGINVFALRYICVTLSGVFAGFGGASMSLAVVSLFSPTLISGQGYIALAAMIFGNWRPRGIMWGCLLFGAAEGLAVYMGGRTNVVVPTQVLSMLPYIITLLVLVLFIRKSNAPAADGVPYEKSSSNLI
ncbi:ABC transporter permease [Iocasia frigidifontis]|uniref:ABC transporter permease n=1 Tax=Iocasia fonsfrigidae TaxID=2682810 RepID=A0A8A7KFU3_9FIRM|nr:ABC transporter permease [Iocasia fonsfrigidae]QTL98379.1 ABC transporter permease [Iocasia fonsfrigidae]